MAVSIISGGSVFANPSAIVTVNGNRYRVTYDQFSFNDSPSRFSTNQMPWWGSSILADQFATQIGGRLGTPLLGIYGPAFGYDSPGIVDFAFFNGSVISRAAAILSAVSPYAVADIFIPTSPYSAQPYADIQSIGVDALKNQRELVLNQAGSCDQRGWVVYDSEKVKAAYKPKKSQSLCVFAEGGYASGSINGSDSIGGYSTSNASSAYGIEWKPSKQWAVGAACGYGTAGLGGFNFQDTSAYINSNINSANIYGVYRPNKNWKVAALAGYSNFNYTGSRTFLGDTANSNFSANGYTAALQGSYDIILSTDYNNKKNPLNPVLIKPLLGFAWGANQQARFSETGQGTLLNVQGQTTNSLMGTVGASVEAPIPLNKSKTTALTPRFGVAYQCDFLANQDGNKSIAAALVDDATTSFTAVGQNRGPNSVYLDLGADLQINPQVVIYVSANYQAFTNGNQIGYQGGLRVKF